MRMRRVSCALAVAAGVILVSGGCARDVLAPQARAEGGATVRIIGPSPVGTDQEPMFIVDGVTAEGSRERLHRIEPNDIHSIEILKGPATVRIYGTAGRNDVIVIRTRRGVEQ